MKTQDTQTSDKKETMSALIFIAVIYLILCLAGKLSASPKADFVSIRTVLTATLCEQYGGDEIVTVFNKGADISIQVNAENQDSCVVILKDANGNEILSQTHKISLGLNLFTLKPKVEKGVYVIHIVYKNNKYNKVFILEPIRN
ncbi:MAG TPA: T9SS type A sorting domain-containing protein [Bacteroidia bacterium]|jgi:hypothetical protein|nr:T9SS type A sorting domain-containing protein [Bacteroidia bacterium]